MALSERATHQWLGPTGISRWWTQGSGSAAYTWSPWLPENYLVGSEADAVAPEVGLGTWGRPGHQRSTMELGLLYLPIGSQPGTTVRRTGQPAQQETLASWRGGQGVAGEREEGIMPLASQLNSSPTSLSLGGSQEAGEGQREQGTVGSPGRGSGGEGPHPLSPCSCASGWPQVPFHVAQAAGMEGPGSL